jgi:hypothetical protein
MGLNDLNIGLWILERKGKNMNPNIRNIIAASVAISCCTMASGVASADVDEVTLGASSVWSNWYWPRKDTLNPNMYDNGECMARYDDYDLPSSESAQTWEADPDNHVDYPGVADGLGHCHAWAAASIWEPQPTSSEIHSGVEFRIRDKKALLTELYIAGLTDGNYQFKKDWPSPGYVWKRLRKEIAKIAPTDTDGVAKPVIMDLAPEGDVEWNYPVFRYKVEYTGTSPNISGSMWFYYAKDGEASYADDTASHYQITSAYTFSGVARDGNGEPLDTSGQWTGATADAPPGKIWRSNDIKRHCIGTDGTSWTCMSGNPHLDSEYLRVFVDSCTGNSVYVDKSATENGTGTLVRPFKTVAEGVSEVCSKGQLLVTAGTYTEKLQIKTKLTLKNAGGAVTIKAQ